MHLNEIRQKYENWTTQEEFANLVEKFEESKSLVNFLDIVRFFENEQFTNERMTFMYFDLCNCFKTKVYNLEHFKNNGNDQIDEWFRQ